jgi:hypothetical protein
MRDAVRDVGEGERGPSGFFFEEVVDLGASEGCLRSDVDEADSFSFRFLISKP